MAAPEVQLKSGTANVKIRNPVTCLILDIVTLGIYGLFWWYYVNREMADLGRAKGTDELGDNPAMSVLALIPGGLIIVPAIMTMINTGKRIKASQRLAGQREEANEWLGLVFCLVFFPIALWYYQDQLNKVWAVEAEAPALEPGAGQPAASPTGPEGAAAPGTPEPAAPGSGAPAPGTSPPPQPPPGDQPGGPGGQSPNP
ncbi:MAG TPA: DUF4234 domain-containing protein [Thermoleophilaceae bacterium]|nr:DUF4234 domain-containing protein [Thermoleophilaceae bacterium]